MEILHVQQIFTAVLGEGGRKGTSGLEMKKIFKEKHAILLHTFLKFTVEINVKIFLS